jgi:hypothetical protein
MAIVNWNAAVLGIIQFIAICATCQQTSLTADQIFDKSMEALGGAERAKSLSTAIQRGEVTDNLTKFVDPVRWTKEHGSIETYYRAPNLVKEIIRYQDSSIAWSEGCDGTMAWEFSPRFGLQQHEQTTADWRCSPFKPVPVLLRELGAKLKLKKQKKIDGRPAFAILTEVPSLHWKGIYYYDVETFLPLRTDISSPVHSKFRPSDFRDVEGMKVAFQQFWRVGEAEKLFNLKDIEFNVPIDDSVFKKP